MAMTSSNSCAIVGTGVLGTSLCRQILQAPDLMDMTVTGITKTTSRHDSILSQVTANSHDENDTTGGSSSTDHQRFFLKTRDQVANGEKFKSVVFCAPPSGFEDYPAAVKDAVENLWQGPSGGGVFVFTSSGGVYGQETGIVTEATPPVAANTGNLRSDRLVLAEQAALSAGGCALRLAGLYNLHRGAHNYWLASGKDTIAGIPDGIVNLLHYDDAAGACLAAMRVGSSVCAGRVFLISDGHPLTRLQICQSSVQAKIYQEYKDKLPAFTQEAGSQVNKGKIYDGSLSNKLLKWSPQYESFDAFMASHA
jgi:nucleoside-diphosphate-sugar epimerase